MNLTHRFKRCSKCKEVLPLSEKYFHRNATTKDGYYYICKKCRLKNDTRNYKGARLDRPRFTRGSKWFQNPGNHRNDFSGNNEGLIYMAMDMDGVQTAITEEHVRRAREMADRSGAPVVWRRGDSVEGLPQGIRQRIEMESK